MKVINIIALILIIVGAFNWGSIGFFDFDFVKALTGHAISRIIYAIVGLAGIWSLSFFRWFANHTTKNERH